MTSSLLLFEHITVVTVLVFLLFMQEATSGDSTDFVSVYYQIYKYRASQQVISRDADTKLLYELHQAIPDEVIEKIQPFGLDFASLPGLLQRALIWDSGYAVGDNGTFTKVYTRCDSSNSGVTMQDLALEMKKIGSIGCTIQKCSTDDDISTSWSYSSDCGPTQLDDIVRCSCTSVKTKVKDAPVWASGETRTASLNSTTIPETAIRRHTWSDVKAGRSAILFAIHTSSKLQDFSYSDLCTSDTPLSSITIPCIEYRAADDRWCRPKGTSLITKWLDEYVVSLDSSGSAELLGSSSPVPKNVSTQYNNDDSVMEDTNVNDATPGSIRRSIPALIVGGAALMVTCIAVFIYLRRRSERRKEVLQNSGANQLSMCSTNSTWKDESGTRKHRNNPLIEREDVFGNPHTMHDFIEVLSSSPTAWESSPLSLSLALTAESLASGSPKPDQQKNAGVLNALANDPYLKHAQIQFDLLQFHHLIARGAHSEVWLCVLRDRCVAVKKITKEKRKNLDEIRAFVKTIRLNAPLQHPSILSFIGVAWSSLQNLCLVTEYMELGDLHEYLRQSNPNRDQAEIYEDFMTFSMSWKREKMHLLLDITRGLLYLHRNRIIHGDLKAKNVLLSAELDAKLAGFGVVGHRNQNVLDKSQRTLRQDSPFWTAPEVLAGGVQSEKADIYSLGVALTELDTHRSPYANAVTTRGNRMSPLQVLQHIMSGHLKPTLSPTCPSEIVDLADWCLQRDPNLRPNASDVVQAVRSIPGFNLDEFSL